MDKEAMKYIHRRILLSHKKEWKFAICNSMDGPGEHYLGWNKSDRERQILYHWYVESKMIQQTSEYNKKKQSHIYREKLVVTSEKGKEEGQYRDRGLRGTNYYV